ncbi:MAG: LytTR family transcriptional regulator [Lachnospiraceae bacterium]|nr:LytTR family transcriptional regulator [Lachnospiraceae bacterium]
MLIYYLIDGNEHHPPNGIPKEYAVCCRSAGELLGLLRERNGSEPFILLKNSLLTEILLVSIAHCFPEGYLIEADCELPARLEQLRAGIIRLRPGFSVRSDRIRYIECDGRKLHFHLLDYVRTINYPIKKLPDLSGYGLHRCHGSFLVNFQYVRSACPAEFRMEGGESIPISRKFRSSYTVYRNRAAPVSQKSTRPRS